MRNSICGEKQYLWWIRLFQNTEAVASKGKLNRTLTATLNWF